MDGSMPQEVTWKRTEHIYRTESVTIKTGNYDVSPDILKIAVRWKMICLENMYTWKSMDRDIIQEALKIDGR